MFGAVATDTTRKNFAALGDETAQFRRIFIVYLFDFIHAKRTNFFARASASFSTHDIFSY
jgi:hypothetical protein